MKKTDQNLLFEKFRILETIKQDSYRAIYIAEHIFLNKIIFLKTINKKNLTDYVLLYRFKRESQILAKLDHPNIIKVWDFGTYEDYLYISFEHFQSRNLREILKQNLLDDENKEELVLQLMTGLQYAHDHQIIHRDLKPENILIDESMNLKIADFGLATIENQAGSTEDTTIVGTPAYMSPEQIQGQELTSQSDLFSLGIIIYEIYCRKNPFLGADTGATLNNILNLNSDQLQAGLEKMPEDISKLVKQLLSKNINKRPKQINSPGIEASSIINNESLKKIYSVKHKSVTIWIVAAVLSVIIIGYFTGHQSIQKLFDNQFRESNSEQVISHDIDSSKLEPVENVIKKNEQPIHDTITKLAINDISDKKVDSEQASSMEVSKDISLKPGLLMIECQPWADIYIDDIKKEATPLKNPLQVAAGKHQIKLVHPEYPHYKKLINLNPEESYHISVNLDTTICYLNCRVHPWGEIIIDGKSIGQTPLNRYIRLEAGEHNLIVKNPGFSDFTQTFTINKNDTISFNINLNKRNVTKTADSN
jgi:serine/threonine protein kinase